MRTQDYLKLIKDCGWVLKTHKDPFYGHSYYIWNPARAGWGGSCKYFSRQIFDNLVKQGIVPIRNERRIMEKNHEHR